MLLTEGAFRLFPSHLKQSRLGPACFFALLGAAAGWAAWSPAGTVWALALAPILWSTAPSRAAAFGAFLGYYLAGARDVPEMVTRYFPDAGMSFGIGIWTLHASILALAWTWAWPKPESAPRAVFWRFWGLSVALMLPPLGIIAWISPQLLAGRLYPGWGYIGLLLTVTLFACLAIAARLRSPRALAAAAALALLAPLANWLYQPPAAPAGWHAIDTQLGKFPADRAEAFQRHHALINLVRQRLAAGAQVIVLPEEIADVWRPAAQYWWQEVDALAKSRNATVLVGADLPEGKRFRDALVALGGESGSFAARQPMPVGLWRPWSGQGAIADWTRPGVGSIGGQVVAFSFCYEDLLMWPHLEAMRHQPTAMVSVANNWFARGLDVTYIQRTSIEAVARLFGVPLVRALNT